jgi:hypothetical protein
MFLSPIFGQDFRLGIILVVVGLSINILSLRCILVVPADKPYHFVFLLLFFCSVITPFPYNLPFILLSLGCFFRLFRLRLSLFYALEMGCLLSGCILILHVMLLPIYFKISPRLPDLHTFVYPVYLFLQLFGIEAGFNEHFLFIQGSKNVYSFANNIEKLGLYLWMNILLGCILIIIFFYRGKKFQAALTIICSGIGYLFLRYAALIIAYDSYLTIVIFLNSWVNLATFLPLIILYSKWFFLDKEPRPAFSVILAQNIFNRSSILKFIFTVLGVFLVVGAWGFNDPGKMKKGRVLINEKHSNWEWTTDKFDKTTYGQKAAYNYYCLSYYLKHFYSVDTNFDHLNQEALKDVDVLIIKMPTEALRPDEVKAIGDYVENGGGLYLIGDHTNVFGTSGYLNQLSEQFGIRFNYDATYDLVTGNLSLYESSKLFAHPIVTDLPPFLFGTSCSLDGPITAEDIITGYQLRAVELDYAQKNFFPERIDLPDLKYGIFLQSCAIKHGKGRVLAFSDSTVFSNFWMFMPGKAELLLKSIDWLNRENIFSKWTNTILFVFGVFLISFAASCCINKNTRVQGFISIFIYATLAFLSSLFIFNFANERYYVFPEAKKEFQKVFFDLEHSNMSLPVRSLVPTPETSYETFFVLTQRLGYVPKAIEKLEDGLKENSIVIIINPNMTWIQKDHLRLLNFVEEGGRLIVLDNRCNENSSSNYILQPYNIRQDFTPLTVSIFKDPLGRHVSTTDCATRVNGGTPVVSTLNNEVIVSVIDKGKGRIIVMSDSRLFSDRFLGTSMSIPNSYQKLIFELAFWILEELTITGKR